MQYDRNGLNELEYLNYDVYVLKAWIKKIKRRITALILVWSDFNARPNIALTFDDGPHPDWTPKLLNILKQHGIKATFFFIGGRVDQYPDIVKQAHEAGHLIGNHTYTHLPLPQQNDSTVLKELRDANMAIQSVSGKRPIYFRPPYGETNRRINRLAKRVGLSPILWSIDTNDWRGLGVDPLVTTLMSAKKGSIILCHDGVKHSEQTLEAVDEAIPRLQAKGFNFVTIAEL